MACGCRSDSRIAIAVLRAPARPARGRHTGRYARFESVSRWTQTPVGAQPLIGAIGRASWWSRDKLKLQIDRILRIVGFVCAARCCDRPDRPPRPTNALGTRL